ncbi:MAG: biopolymer transporter ExbD [Candidatus Brocadiaceae bacterium]|uniref:ExbD/TolR family protein n=1 Tax=Candidatus Tripitaka californicus TaxID=3367616 RepID=UPI0040262026|nr:biopolymer transporter ExbD [Planctomycetota bacterium]MDI6761196.1 biopolymer transporter ExbD [Candidatus Brocadiaceae bacterium]
MNFRTKQTLKTGINIASLVDMLFILLIFFVVTSTFVEQPSIRLDLPSTRHADTAKLEDLIVTIDKEGEMFLKQKPVTAWELGEAFREAVRKRKETILILRADKDANYGSVVAVMDIARGAGLKRITALTTAGPGQQE